MRQTPVKQRSNASPSKNTNIETEGVTQGLLSSLQSPPWPVFFCFPFLRQGVAQCGLKLTMQPRMTLISWSLCLSVPSAGTAGVHPTLGYGTLLGTKNGACAACVERSPGLKPGMCIPAVSSPLHINACQPSCRGYQGPSSPPCQDIL